MSWLHKNRKRERERKGCGGRPESQTERKRCRRSQKEAVKRDSDGQDP